MIDFTKLRKIAEEATRVQELYEMFDEDARLKNTKAARVEFYTNTRYIQYYLKQGNSILEVGAGAGEYCLYFAEQGYDVSAIELSEANINKFQAKIKDHHRIELRQGNALDLSCYSDNSFDIVLLFGPLYHLQSDEDKIQCIKEAKRVCKYGGIILYAFISNDMVVSTEFFYDKNYLNKDSYNHDTFKVGDFPFVFMTLDNCRKVMTSADVNIIKEVASDGLSEILAEHINQLDDYGYEQYLKYHYYCCEKPELLGYSSHLLFIEKNIEK